MIKKLLFSSLFLIFSAFLFAQEPVRISGTVLDEKNKKPLADVMVLLEPLHREVYTDASGVYIFDGIPVSTYTLKAFIYGYELKSVLIDTAKGAAVDPVFLRKAGSVYLQEIVVRKKKRKIEGTKAVMRPAQIKNTSTSLFSDTVASLAKMPGVAASEFSGMLYIRGGTPWENIAIMDDVPIMWPYHWGGRLSIFNPDMVEKVDFYTGGFPAEYGMATSGVIDVKIKKGNFEKARGFANLSAAEATLEVDGPIHVAQQSSFIIGARRTHYDLLLPLFTDREGVIFPYFSDSHIKLYSKLNEKDSLSYNMFYSNEGMKWEFSAEDAQDDDTIEEGDSFHYQDKSWIHSVQWEHVCTDRLSVRSTFAYHFMEGFADLDTAQFPIKNSNKLHTFILRSDADYSVNDENSLSLGYVGYNFYGDFRMEGYVERTHYTGTITRESLDYYFDNRVFYNGAYIQNEYEPLKDDLTISYGVRYESMDLARHDVFSPRAGLKKKIADRTFLNLGWGIFYRYEINIKAYDTTDGNPDLRPEQAAHYIAGIERDMDRNLRMKTDIFYKEYRDIVVDDPVKNYVNGAIGNAYGFEAMLEKKEGGRWDGWISYTFGFSRRKVTELVGYYDPTSPDYDPYNRETITVNDWYYPSYDQTHTISAVVNYTVDEKWSVYSSCDYHTGRPYTEVYGPLQVSGTNPFTGQAFTDYLPLKGKYNDTRLPDYLRLDLKAIQKIKISRFDAEWYLEFINCIARKNISSINYTNNYTVRKESTYFPFLMIAGIKVFF